MLLISHFVFISLQGQKIVYHKFVSQPILEYKFSAPPAILVSKLTLLCTQIPSTVYLF